MAADAHDRYCEACIEEPFRGLSAGPAATILSMLRLRDQRARSSADDDDQQVLLDQGDDDDEGIAHGKYATLMPAGSKLHKCKSKRFSARIIR